MLAFLVLSGVLSESALRGIALRRRMPRELLRRRRPRWSRSRSATRSAASPPSRWWSRTACASAAASSGPPAASSRCASAAGETECRSYRFRADAARAVRVPGLRRIDALPVRSVLEVARDRGARAGARLSGDRARDARRATSAARARTANGRGPRGTGPTSAACATSPRAIPRAASTGARPLRQRELLVRDVESEHAAEIEVRLRTDAAIPARPSSGACAGGVRGRGAARRRPPRRRCAPIARSCAPARRSASARGCSPSWRASSPAPAPPEAA